MLGKSSVKVWDLDGEFRSGHYYFLGGGVYWKCHQRVCSRIWGTDWGGLPKSLGRPPNPLVFPPLAIQQNSVGKMKLIQCFCFPFAQSQLAPPKGDLVLGMPSKLRRRLARFSFMGVCVFVGVTASTCLDLCGSLCRDCKNTNHGST